MSTMYNLIIAGGSGTRFYPLSTPEYPKQFLTLYGNHSLLQHTSNRICRLTQEMNILIATNKKYISLVQSQLPEIHVDQIIGEPLKKNTAPCIALAAWLISQKDPEAVMAVFPADHYIGDDDLFSEDLKRAITYATHNSHLMTFGIVPRWPSTEYGYIKMGQPLADHSTFVVQRFVEKPDADTASKYINTGQYLWNSGIFVWNVKTILDEIKRLLPDMYQLLQNLNFKNGQFNEEQIEEYFNNVDASSIDYGIMEKSDRVVVVKARFEWSDLGSFDALQRIAEQGSITINQDIMDQYNKVTNK